MPARQRNQRRQTVDQFERREHYADVATGARPDALVDRVLGIDFPKSFQREGRSGAVARQVLASGNKPPPYSLAPTASTSSHVRRLRRASAHNRKRALPAPCVKWGSAAALVTPSLCAAATQPS